MGTECVRLPVYRFLLLLYISIYDKNEKNSQGFDNFNFSLDLRRNFDFEKSGLKKVEDLLSH